MKKEAMNSKDQNNYGVWSLIIGMFSVMGSPIPIAGFILAVVGFFLSRSQEKRERNSWSKAGKILSILGAIFSILFFLIGLWFAKNPQLFQQIAGGGAYGI